MPFQMFVVELVHQSYNLTVHQMLLFQFYFKCLWLSCFMVYDSLNDLLQHILSHMEQLTGSNHFRPFFFYCVWNIEVLT